MPTIWKSASMMSFGRLARAKITRFQCFYQGRRESGTILHLAWSNGESTTNHIGRSELTPRSSLPEEQSPDDPPVARLYPGPPNSQRLATGRQRARQNYLTIFTYKLTSIAPHSVIRQHSSIRGRIDCSVQLPAGYSICK